MKLFFTTLYITIFLFSSLAFSANINLEVTAFEDIDMTRALIEKEEKETSTHFGTFIIYPKNYGNNIMLYGFFEIKADLAKSKCKPMRFFYFNIADKKVQFEKNDIIDFGKQEMFKRAVCYLQYSNIVFDEKIRESAKKRDRLEEKFIVPNNE